MRFWRGLCSSGDGLSDNRFCGDRGGGMGEFWGIVEEFMTGPKDGDWKGEMGSAVDICIWIAGRKWRDSIEIQAVRKDEVFPERSLKFHPNGSNRAGNYCRVKY